MKPSEHNLLSLFLWTLIRSEPVFVLYDVIHQFELLLHLLEND